MWSLGNEAGYGSDFLKMRKAIRAADPQLRPIHYADMNSAADMDSQTYPTIEWLKQYAAGTAIRKGQRGKQQSLEQNGSSPSGKPFVANEYAHAQENSLGNFQDYWDVFDKYPMLLGGFIWEWSDQSLYKTDSTGKRFFAYGGDFGDYPNDGRFCIKGLVSATRIPKPQYWEVQKVLQYVTVSAQDPREGVVRVKNNYAFISLSGLDAEWQLTKDGKIIRKGRLAPLDIAPGDTATVRIPWGNMTWDPLSEYFLTVEFRLRKKTLWANAGQIVARDQLDVSAPPRKDSVEPRSAVAWTRSGKDWIAHAGETTVKVDGSTGMITSILKNGRQYLKSPVVPNFWRAPLDNDLGWKVPQIMGAWQNEGADAQLEDLSADTDSGRRQLTAYLSMPKVSSHMDISYSLSVTGRLRIAMDLELGEKSPELPRIGFQFAIPRQYSHITWYGRGPQENYVDRKTAAFVGIYKAKVDDWVTPYVRPQENANRCDVRWVDFTGAGGKGLNIQAGERLLGISAWPYTQNDLESTSHNYLLPRRDFITVNIDGWQMGVGGDDSWGLPVHKKYRIVNKGMHRYAFYLKPR